MTIEKLLELDILDAAYMINRYEKWTMKFQEYCQKYSIGIIGQDVFAAILDEVEKYRSKK